GGPAAAETAAPRRSNRPQVCRRRRGRPMECRDAQFYLRFRRPGSGELGPEVAGDLDRHLAGCEHCAAEAAAASAFDTAVATAMTDVMVPAGLRNRLIAH